MTDPFKLSQTDRMSPIWLSIERHLHERLSQLRQQNDATLPTEATEKLRGRIAQIKEILALAQDRITLVP